MPTITERDADVVRRYVRYLKQRASAGDDASDEAIVDHEAEVLWALARAICGEGLVAHVPLLRRASLDLLERGGRRLCGNGECQSLRLSDRHHDDGDASGGEQPSAPSRDPTETEALKELGRALLELRARFELQQ
jgi:hypothetical protein